MSEQKLNPAGSGDPAYKATHDRVVGRLPSAGGPRTPTGGTGNIPQSNPAGSGDPAYKGASSPPSEPPPCRLRRLHRVWPDRDGNISYLLTLCVEGRARVLDKAETFQRLTAFLLDSPARYRWFPRRFVVMPDHLHLIAHQGHDAVRLGQWLKALKAVVGGLERREDGGERPVGAPGLQDGGRANAVPGAAGSGDPAYNTKASAPVALSRRDRAASNRRPRASRIHPIETRLALAGGVPRSQIAHPGERTAQMGIRLPEPGALRFGATPGTMAVRRRDFLRTGRDAQFDSGNASVVGNGDVGRRKEYGG